MLTNGDLNLRSKRLHMRPFGPGDAFLVARILRDPKVVFWHKGQLPMKIIRGGIRYSQRLNKKGTGWWLIFQQQTGRLIGDIMLQPLQGTREIELGYHLLPDQWGNGYATEAAHRLVQYGFERLALPRICAVVLPNNHRSLRVVHKLGMVPRGTHLHAGLKHRYFTLQRDEYESKPAR